MNIISRTKRIGYLAVRRALSELGFSFGLEEDYQTMEVAALRRLFKDRSVDLVIDVGANRGQYVQMLRWQVGYAGRIISIEPNPDLVSYLKKRFRRDRNWTLAPVALGADESFNSLNIMANDSLTSLLSPSVDEVNDLDEQNKVVKKVSVNCTRLDKLLANDPGFCNASSPFLKSDTQGFDLEVIKGASEIIQKFTAIEIEIPILKLYHGSPDMHEVFDLMRSLNFKLFHSSPVTVTRDLYCIEINGIFVRDKSA